jgi:5'-nucleotidase
MIDSIAIDMDGVIADIELHTLNWYQKKCNVVIHPEDIIGLPQLEALPEKDAVWKFLHTPGFFRTLPPVKGAIDAVRRLTRKYDIFIVSSAMEFPHSLNEKYEWLQEHFPFISWRKLIFCGEKNRITADVLIDDYPKNLRSFKGIPLLFSAMHNMHETNYTRLHNWENAVQVIECL